MKTIVLLTFLLAVASPALAGTRYDQSPNSYLYPAESSTQFKLDEMQRRLDQAELKRLLDYNEQRATSNEQRLKKSVKRRDSKLKSKPNRTLRSALSRLDKKPRTGLTK